MFDDDDPPLIKPFELLFIKIEPIHISIYNVHSILCTFNVPCLINLYFKRDLLAILYHLHEPVYSRTWVLILFVVITMIHHVLMTHPAVTRRDSQSIHLLPLTPTQIHRIEELIFLIFLLILLRVIFLF